jgi:energy-coupling factor transporter ATP-binding protein EcfA2
MGAGASRSPDLIAAEVRKLDAETAAVATRAKAETRARAQAEATANLHALAGGALLAGLALDFYLHESPTHIRRRMLHMLRRCSLPATLPPAPALLLPVPQHPLTLGFLPRLLIGPSGCGKSTLLGSLAAGLATPAPIVLVRMRLPATPDSGAAGTAATATEAQALMDDTARQIFSQIGFPLRRSLLASVFSRGVTLQGGGLVQAELSIADTRSRLLLALRVLFEVCEALKLERQRTMPPLDAAPVLLFDEVQDLIKDARLARAGGRLVLSALGSLLVGYSVDRKAVRAVVTGSSAELAFAFEECSALRGARWAVHSLLDPEEAATRAALAARGYSAEEARGMVRLCGTRLRLLERPLAEGAGACSYGNFARSAEAQGAAAFASVFAKLGRADAAALGALLDGIEACEAAAERSGAAGAGGAAPAPAPALPVPARPGKDQLTGDLQRLDVAPILFVSLARELFFQSQLHRRSWALLRSKYRLVV